MISRDFFFCQCSEYGFLSGEITCTSSCGLDFAACTTQAPASACNNNNVKDVSIAMRFITGVVYDGMILLENFNVVTNEKLFTLDWTFSH